MAATPVVAALITVAAMWTPAYAQDAPAAPAAPDTTAPTVSTTAPARDAGAVPRGDSVTAMFSEPVEGVDATTFTLRGEGAPLDVVALVSYDATSGVATLDPVGDLDANTKYTATLTGGASAIRDAAGNPLATLTWSFVSAAAAAPAPPAE